MTATFGVYFHRRARSPSRDFIVSAEDGKIRLFSFWRQSFSRAIQAWRWRRQSPSPNRLQWGEGALEVFPAQPARILG